MAAFKPKSCWCYYRIVANKVMAKRFGLLLRPAHKAAAAAAVAVAVAVSVVEIAAILVVYWCGRVAVVGAVAAGVEAAVAVAVGSSSRQQCKE